MPHAAPARRLPALLALACFIGAAFSAVAADWPQHLGPTQDAVSAETGLLDAWPAGGPPELWRHDVGVGFAGSAVVDGKVFLNDREMGVADVLRVFDLDTGKELWSYRYEAPGRVNFPGSRSTPSVTDTHVFITGGLGHVHAINRKTRKPDWSLNIYDRYPDDNKMFGFGISPVVVDGLLLLSPTAQGDPVVVAVDPATGRPVWESQATLDTVHTHHTPVVRTMLGRRGIACRDRERVYFIDIKTGETIWSHKVFDAKPGPHVTIPPITMVGEDLKSVAKVFVTNGYEDGSVLLTVRADGQGGYDVREAHRIPEGGQVHPAIYDDGLLFLNINENANLRGRNLQGGLACIDAATLDVRWRTRNQPNLNRGATLLVDGKLIAFDGDTGELLLIQPDRGGFKLLSRFEALPPKGRSNNAWSPLVVSDGRLVVRDHRQIVCYDLREKIAIAP
ncbi:MAG: PQQ-binding-like beta-propeller repeat protein [Phycisphaeraceae bacterium]